jgi:hypothetical protein
VKAGQRPISDVIGHPNRSEHTENIDQEASGGFCPTEPEAQETSPQTSIRLNMPILLASIDVNEPQTGDSIDLNVFKIEESQRSRGVVSSDSKNAA